MKNLLNLNQLSVISRDWTENGPKMDREWTENRPTRLRVLAKYAALLLMLLTLGVGQAWADDKGFYEVYMVYDKNGTEYNYTYNGSNGSMDLGTITSSFKIKKMYLKVWDTWGDQAFEAGSSGLGYKTQSGSDTDYKANNRTSKSGNNYELQHTNMNLTIASNTNPSGNYTFTHWWFADGTWTDTYYLKNGSSNCAFTYKIAPPAVKSSSVAISATNTAPGSGTGLSSGSPIILISGMASTLTITATQNHTDANSALWCKFGTGSYSSTTTYNIASGTTQTNQTLALRVKYRNNSASLDGAETTTTIYYKWAAPAPAITMTSVTPSSSIVAGNDITLVGTRANSSNTISFQYTTNDGSTWTDITPKTTSGDSPKTITWTVPDAHGATQTFKFRAKLAEATPIYSSKSSGVSVYNTKTIKVKNTNNWGTMKLYLYSASAEKEAWPGSTTGITSAGGQWKTVVLTSEWPYFILNDNDNGNQIKGDKTYSYSSSVTDGNCYAISSGTGTSLTFSSATCPSAPTVTTSDASTIRETSATLGGNVTALGNDKVTDYGYYYSTNSALSSSNLAVGTKVQVGTSKTSTGSYTNSQTGLTANTTYYVIAYATNGQGTSYGAVNNFTTLSTYTVTVTAGAGGSASPSSVTAGQYLASGTITASPNTGYVFYNWTKTSGSGTVTFTNANAVSTTLKSTNTATVRANFVDKWTIKGSGTELGAWGTYNSMTPTGNTDEYSVTVALAASTTYDFKVVNRVNGGGDGTFYGKSSTTFTREGTTSVTGLVTTAGDTYNMHLTTDIAGNYTFTFKYNASTSSMKVTVGFPTAYKLTYGIGTIKGTNGSITCATASGSYVASGNSVTLTAPAAKSGYTWKGWYTNAAGTTGNIADVDRAITVTMNATKTLYACYNYATYTATLSTTGCTGYGSGAPANQTATYTQAMPTITPPTATSGYCFMGYWDDEEGEGTQYYNANGTSAHAWDKTSGATLYAYFKKAEITALTFDAASVEASGAVGVTPTIDPVPEPTVSVCWRVLYDNDNPLSPQPEISWDGTKATFTAPAASGTYKVEAKLYNSGSCGSGTLLSTRVQSFTVAGVHTVTVQYKCGEDDIKASTTTTGRPFDWSGDITAPDIFGYTFSGWTAGDGITIKDGESSTATTHIKATYNGTLTANYTQKSIIYFKNTLGWSDVYVNFYTASDWDSSDNGSGSQKGAGNNGVTNRNKHMTQIGSTDVWYYDYGYNDGGSSITPSLYVSFTSASQNNVNEFWATNPGIGVVYPANYPDAISTDKSSENGFKAATPMFVPLATQDAVAINVGGGGRANYYNAGYWTKYLPGTGYTLEIYNSGGSYLKSAEFTSGDELMPMKAVVDLEAGQTYKFQLRRGGTDSYGIYYGNSGTMTYANHGQGIAWEMINTMSPSFTKCGITTNAAGDYTFNLSYSGNSSTPPQYRLRMEVDYPVATGDYRVIYKHTGQANYKASAIVQKVNNGKDTVSFFIKPGSSPSMKIQRATVSGGGVVSWSDYSTISSSVSGLAKDSVYNICLTMNGSGAISVENVEVYTGNFYIRTDAANSKWDNYRSDPDHLMTFSEYSITHGGYSHYYCHWVQAGTNRKNVKFCIANDYSPSISDTLAREPASGTWANIASFISEGGDILSNANVRFTWNQHDNTISRAYIDGAQEDGSEFLVLLNVESGADKIKKSDGTALSGHKVTFSDNENWIYEANVKAQPKAAYRLISTWGTGGTVITQYFKGSSTTTETLIDGSGSTWYDIRLLYDFKTNRLVAAWVPSDATITSNNAINADVMFIREHQGDIAQLTFTASGQISAIKTAYGVLKFNKWTLANKEKTGGHSPLAKPASVYERSLFWISFPFRVKLSEVFGFGTYGTHWAIQRYDGAKRAEIGHFAENGSFWRWMSRNTEYLEPNQGYLLAIDLDLLGESSDVWGPESRSSQIELYFPSYGDMPNISNASVAQTIPSHECTINRATGVAPLLDTGDPRTSYNRTIFDSHWNVLSVPTYVNTTAVSYANTTWTAAIGPKFLYTWNASDNTITATTASGYTYHAMHSYMVQYAGNLTWTASSGSPASIVARKTYAETPKEVEFRLELQQNEQEIDRTFVVLSNDEEVSADFQFGEDMTKEFNAKKSAIYTFIADEAVAAGNTLPMSEQITVVPVGVDIKADGDYTFAMPDGTSGVGVVLIDNETGIRTSLSALDYTVFLEAGTYDKRFMMEISPIKQGTTGIDMINGDASANGVRKLLIDQKMYIIKGDKMYDATGRRVE